MSPYLSDQSLNHDARYRVDPIFHAAGRKSSGYYMCEGTYEVYDLTEMNFSIHSAPMEVEAPYGLWMSPESLPDASSMMHSNEI
ncbi:hypothetical protein K503DRAFT_775835 [Rhizopogon vinicolor AM-OR11-026]|uniref:Uncharacterized protein n=1 Tax=Rhizopogon vinicolor AM-OR11-026 TaxID=1314800 RepID=A0A1B7MKW6_9AGAM|nr:hypothetical protein K503DRAFT_775835 [Rhizopogon vinicolor AM-OR11-026]